MTLQSDYYHRSARLATLGFFLAKAFKELLEPKQLVIEHSFGDGLFCHEAHWQPIEDREIRLLQHAMEAWIGNMEPIVFTEKPKEEALAFFRANHSLSKQEVVRRWQGDTIPVLIFENHWDICLEPVTRYKNMLTPFELRPYNHGFLLRLGEADQELLPPFQDRPRLFSILEEQEAWSRALGISTVRELNELVRRGEHQELMWVAEGLHEKKLARIADQLVKHFPDRPLICVAGPSSSGKTTFAKRLCIQLRVNGYRTLPLSMDDYFRDRRDIPVGPDGTQDFEALSAMDVDLLTERVDRLLAGDTVPRRKFDFQEGVGRDLDETDSAGEKEFILLEGIHGLNPALIQALGESRVQKIYISAITTLNLDAQHRISTSDNRLLRRLVRDYQFRGYAPRDTIARWDSVRQGEERHIFPYQEEADYLFNSSLIYELSVLAGLALPLLEAVAGDDIVAEKALYLRRFLQLFESIDPGGVPSISLLREFIGGSGFSY
ncbi:MAG: nucleoside kinase [Candidatus Neomarinimicrobiota bacterium]|nr:MAG: nucleoside kinase [Candidatus Neomarinimicrobiota bacterium]